jgi:hypothetical protein
VYGFRALLSLFGLVNDGYIIRYSKETARRDFVQVGLMGGGLVFGNILYISKNLPH